MSRLLQRRAICTSFWNLLIAVHFHENRLRRRSYTKRFEARTFLSFFRLIYRSNPDVDCHRIIIDQFLWLDNTFINFSVSSSFSCCSLFAQDCIISINFVRFSRSEYGSCLHEVSYQLSVNSQVNKRERTVEC